MTFRKNTINYRSILELGKIILFNSKSARGFAFPLYIRKIRDMHPKICRFINTFINRFKTTFSITP